MNAMIYVMNQQRRLSSCRTLPSSGKLFSPLVPAQWLQYKRSGPSWAFRNYILSLVSCFVRKILYSCRWLGLLSAMKNLKIAYFSASAILIALPIIFSSSSYGNFCFRTWWWRQGIIYPATLFRDLVSKVERLDTRPQIRSKISFSVSNFIY